MKNQCIGLDTLVRELILDLIKIHILIISETKGYVNMTCMHDYDVQCFCDCENCPRAINNEEDEE